MARGPFQLLPLGLLFLFALPWPAFGQQPDEVEQRRRQLRAMTLEELMNVEVTSVARKEQALMEAPSAIYVIRSEDLARSEARTLPEALRRVPGVQVARIDSNKWAVSARGFNDRFANKLQVLVDGRIVYDPLFSGVEWDAQDTFAPDIDRIEVIRGPGATLWGSNAVNGVINVLTKPARETQGTHLVFGAGTEERDFAGARYGGKVGEDLHYRVFAQYFNRDAGHGGHDDWFQSRAGFRSDWTPSAGDLLTFQGEYYQGESRTRYTRSAPPPTLSETFGYPLDLSGGHFIARWQSRFSDESDLSAQLSLDRLELDTEFFGQVRHTLTFDFRHRFPFLEGQEVIWGTGYSLTADELEESFTVSFESEAETDGLLHTFLQDEIALFGGAVKLTLGSKFEYNDHTGFEYQPGFRLGWKPQDRHFFWASVSRAVRIPSRSDDDVRFVQSVLPGPPFPTIVALGDDDVVAEELLAYEAGYRVQPIDAISLDLAVFYNDYDNLETSEPGPLRIVPPSVEIPLVKDNKMSGRSFGIEPAVWVRLVEGWTLHGSYTFFRLNLIPDDDSFDPAAEDAERKNPRHQAYIRLSGELADSVDLDLAARYVDTLPAPDVDSYVELDARIAWRAMERLEVALVGTNLLHGDHEESAASAIGEHASGVDRGIYVTVGLRF